MSNRSYSRSLPDRPNLEQLKKQAKSLRDRYQAGDEQAVDLVQHFERSPRVERFGLQDAQRVLARSYGFSSWTRLKERVIIEAIKKCLLDLGANVNARNSAGQTPLHIAARRFWPQRPYDAIVDVLLSRGADKNARDDVGQLP